MPAEGPTSTATLLAAVLLGAGFTAGGEYQSVETRIRAVTTVDYRLVE